MSVLMDEYAGIVASTIGYRKGTSPTGWCSWYYYYEDISEDEMIEVAACVLIGMGIRELDKVDALKEECAIFKAEAEFNKAMLENMELTTRRH